MTDEQKRSRESRVPPRGTDAVARHDAEDRRTVAELAQALADLKRNTAELFQRKKQLQQLNRWFHVALNNMGRGLSMYDDQQRLIVCNKLYRDIYDLPQGLTRPGTPLSRIMRFHVKRETGRDDAEEIARQCKWLEGHVAKLKQGEPFSYTQQLKNGRIVQVTNQPLPDGGWVDIQEDITERRKAEKRITWLAHHDPLTQTANRIYFADELNHALKTLHSGGGFALHWIDLDHFKEVNDELGHPAGDALLKSVASRLRHAVRTDDLVARLGGDEFAVIQTGTTTREDAEELTARLMAAVKGPHDVLGKQLEIGASIGVVIAPEDGNNAEQLLKNVDTALYEAKRAGRGRFAFFSSPATASGPTLRSAS